MYLFGSLIVRGVFVYLVNDFLNVLQDILGLYFFVLLNQIECLELRLAHSFKVGITLVHVVGPGELLDVHLFGVISLVILGQLLATLVSVSIVLSFEVRLTHIKALKIAILVHPLADKLIQVNFVLRTVTIFDTTKLVIAGVT